MFNYMLGWEVFSYVTITCVRVRKSHLTVYIYFSLKRAAITILTYRHKMVLSKPCTQHIKPHIHIYTYKFLNENLTQKPTYIKVRFSHSQIVTAGVGDT